MISAWGKFYGIWHQTSEVTFATFVQSVLGYGNVYFYSAYLTEFALTYINEQ